jgi:uncharacterized membrane protein YhaH (DUF805 family)
MDWKTLFLTADGRIGKRDFWIGFAILFVANLVLGMIPFLGMLISLLLIYPTVCIYSKRLHDAGRTAWLMLVPFGVVVVCMIIAFMMGGAALMGAGMAGSDSAAGAAAMAGMGGAALVIMLGFLVNIAFVLWVGLSNGDPGENRFGPPPVSLTGGTASPPMVS